MADGPSNNLTSALKRPAVGPAGIGSRGEGDGRARGQHWFPLTCADLCLTELDDARAQIAPSGDDLFRQAALVLSWKGLGGLSQC